MDLNDEKTWPAEVLAYLEHHHDVFWAWEDRSGRSGTVSGPQYDRALYGLRAVLNDYTLHGYHCTRLTTAEIGHIMSQGMQPPNAAMLRGRIQVLLDSAVIDAAVARRLMQTNQADEANRANRIWFCFFAPHLAGESGIGDLLGFWGGEALYNSHDRDSETGPILARIGTPCLVEADVPIASLPGPGGLDMKVARQYVIWRGFKTSEPVEHEDRAQAPIAAKSIRRIIQFPEPDFRALTGYNTWKRPLSAGKE
jgi:hypothetical protein